jgi:hypothetical protein
MPLETLSLVGMEIDSVSWRGEILLAGFGGGYGAKAVVGNAAGLHAWTISSAVLADSEDYADNIEDLPSFQYYLEFFRRHTTGGSDVFMIEFRGKHYHASLADPEIPFEMLTIDLFAGPGVTIRQRRIEGQIYNADGSVDLTAHAVNFALNKAVWANRTYAESRPEQAVNGVRHTNDNWAPYDPDGGSGGWDSGPSATAAWLVVDLEIATTFSHAKQFTIADAVDYDTEPTPQDTFTLYGNTAYRMQYWHGTDAEFDVYREARWDASLEQWTTFVTATGNNRVRRDHDFIEVTARFVRFVGDAAADNPSVSQARLVELEIWNRDPLLPLWGPLEVLQRTIRENQWPAGLPSQSATSFTANGGPSAAFTESGDSDLLTFNVFPGLTLNGYVFEPKATPPEGGVVRDAWIICLLGHETVNDGIDRVEYFVDRGFRVVLLGMPNYEPNSSSWTYTRPNASTVTITGSTHSQYASVIEADGHAILPLFLDQVFRAANWIRDQDPLAVIHLTGHSGGGFMCSMAAILDDKAYFSVRNSNAGEMPFSLDDTAVHVEQAQARPWWQGRDWDDLYPIGARYGIFTKSHNEEDIFQALNRHHVLRNLAAEVNAALVAGGYSGSFDIYVDPATSHVYSDAMRQNFVDNCLLFEPAVLDKVTTPVWAAYGMNRLLSTYSGPAIRVRDSLGAEADIGFDLYGSLDADALSGTGPYTIVKVYDQMGVRGPLLPKDDDVGLAPRLNVADKSIRFFDTGDAYGTGFQLPSMVALTQGEAFMRRKLSVSPPDDGVGVWWDFSPSSQESHTPYTDNGFYDHFGSATRRNGLAHPGGLTSWHVMSAFSATNDWAIRINTTVVGTDASNTVEFPATPLWGIGNTAGTGAKGYATALIIFSQKCSTGDRNRVIARL